MLCSDNFIIGAKPSEQCQELIYHLSESVKMTKNLLLMVVDPFDSQLTCYKNIFASIVHCNILFKDLIVRVLLYVLIYVNTTQTSHQNIKLTLLLGRLSVQ